VLSILKEEEIPFVIALNKIDVSKANPEGVENSLFEMGVNIEPKGGNIPVSKN
jgi:signal recognition particle receptor subunit beta